MIAGLRPDAARMNCAHSGAASVAPVPGSDELSSLPTHTTHVSAGVYPANHASLYASLVPVFPAAREAGHPDVAARPVPCVAACRSMRCMS